MTCGCIELQRKTEIVFLHASEGKIQVLFPDNITLVGYEKNVSDKQACQTHCEEDKKTQNKLNVHNTSMSITNNLYLLF